MAALQEIDNERLNAAVMHPPAKNLSIHVSMYTYPPVYDSWRQASSVVHVVGNRHACRLLDKPFSCLLATIAFIGQPSGSIRQDGSLGAGAAVTVQQPPRKG